MCPKHRKYVVSTTRNEPLKSGPDEDTQFKDEDHLRIEWSSSGPYFDDSFPAMDVTFRSVLLTRKV